MSYKIINKTTGDIVTLAEMKTYLRVSGTSEDVLIQSFLNAATNSLEKWMNRDILTTTWENYRHSFYSDLTLRRGGFQSVEKIETYNYNTDSYDLVPADDYKISNNTIFGEICSIESAPNNAEAGDCNYIRITFKTGFGDTKADVPDAVKLAIQMTVAFWYSNRGDCANETVKVPSSAQALIGIYKITNLPGDDC